MSAGPGRPLYNYEQPSARSDRPDYLSSAHGAYSAHPGHHHPPHPVNGTAAPNSRFVHPGQPLHSQVSPVIIQNSSNANSSINNNNNNNNNNNASNNNNNNNSSSSTLLSDADGLPEPPSHFPQLNSLSLSELRRMDDSRTPNLDDFVRSHEHHKALQRTLAGHKARLAESEAELSALQAEFADAQAALDASDSDVAVMQERVKEKRVIVAQLQNEKDEWTTQFATHRLVERLRAKLADSEQTSEQLEEKMLRAEMDFDDFLSQYMACRKLYHERQLKLQQLKQELKSDVSIVR